MVKMDQKTTAIAANKLIDGFSRIFPHEDSESIKNLVEKAIALLNNSNKDSYELIAFTNAINILNVANNKHRGDQNEIVLSRCLMLLQRVKIEMSSVASLSNYEHNGQVH